MSAIATTTAVDPAAVHPADHRQPAPRLAALGLQHVLVMYAGAIAVPLIVGSALKLDPENVAMLISADLFCCCGLLTLIQSLGIGKLFGTRLPVMMGVTFAWVGPTVAMAGAVPGTDGSRAIFGAIITIIGISLICVGIGWAMGGPPNVAPTVDVPKLVAMVDAAKSAAVASSASASGVIKLGQIPLRDSNNHGALDDAGEAIAAATMAEAH